MSTKFINLVMGTDAGDIYELELKSEHIACSVIRTVVPVGLLR